jgi:hypothetical protein
MSLGQHDVTHNEIYERLIQVESKVDRLDEKTEEVVVAFESAKAAFTVLEWIAKAAKPILWIIGLGTVLVTLWERYK